MSAAVSYAATVAGVSLLIALSGSLVPSASSEGVWLGAAVGLTVQVAVFWGFFVRLLPDRRMLAHGLGMLARMVVFGIVALVALRWPLDRSASTLFAMIAVFFVSTVLEPLFLRTETLKRS